MFPRRRHEYPLGHGSESTLPSAGAVLPRPPSGLPPHLLWVSPSYHPPDPGGYLKDSSADAFPASQARGFLLILERIPDPFSFHLMARPGGFQESGSGSPARLSGVVWAPVLPSAAGCAGVTRTPQTGLEKRVSSLGHAVSMVRPSLEAEEVQAERAVVVTSTGTAAAGSSCLRGIPVGQSGQRASSRCDFSAKFRKMNFPNPYAPKSLVIGSRPPTGSTWVFLRSHLPASACGVCCPLHHQLVPSPCSQCLLTTDPPETVFLGVGACVHVWQALKLVQRP